MERALALSAGHRTHPNPRVGAVILAPTGEVIGEGAHHGPGLPHAEIEALNSLAGSVSSGATMVVTLEPCSHHGRTPPCVDAIVAAGLARVVVGTIDPDPKVSGSGIRRLREAGVDVDQGMMAEDVERADRAYFHHRRHGRPLVTLKTASTLDGQTAATDGSSQWITSTDARLDAHALRAESDCILIGAGTLFADDPALTVRIEGWSGAQPVAVVVAGRRTLPETAQLWKRPDTIVVSAAPVDAPVENLVVAADDAGRPDPAAILALLADRGHLSVLLEGGPGLASSFWRAGLIDGGVTYLGARLAGGVGSPVFDGSWGSIGDGVNVEIEAVRRVGPDIRIDWTMPAPSRE